MSADQPRLGHMLGAGRIREGRRKLEGSEASSGATQTLLGILEVRTGHRLPQAEGGDRPTSQGTGSAELWPFAIMQLGCPSLHLLTRAF